MTMPAAATAHKRTYKKRDSRCIFVLILLCLAMMGACTPNHNVVMVAPTGATASCPSTNGKDFSRQDLTNHNFNADPPGSLKGANFSGATLKGAVFNGQDLTGASFQDADLGLSDNGPADFTNTTLDRTCFIGAVMNATDFTDSTIKCADFSSTSLMEADFGPDQNILPGDDGCRTSFSGATIDVNTIATDNWGNVDFTNTKFQNLSSNTFSLQGVDISNAILAGTDFTNIDMTGANLTGVDFSSATLTKAKLDHAALNGTILDNANLSYATLTCARFYGTNADNKDNPNSEACKATAPPVSNDPSKPASKPASLRQANLQHADLSNATLNSAVLSGANLAGAILKHTSFIDATLESSGNLSAASALGADLTGAFFNNAHLNNVQFNNVTLTSAVFDSTTLSGTDFSDSIMPNVSFNKAVLQDVNFKGTILQAATFTNTTMQKMPNGGGEGVNFTCAQLGGANFKDATITAANFEAAVLPPAAACCPQAGGDSWCGTIDITQQAYGAVTYPVLNSTLTCPNGDVAQCTANQWTVTDWRTNLCNNDHTSQIVWEKPDCDVTPGQAITIKDENLKKCILASLPDNPSEVTVNTAAQIREVNCVGLRITDLTGLEYFTSLTRLVVTGNQITQFSLKPFQQSKNADGSDGFQYLETLKIADNDLNLLDISNLPQLTYLDASNNKLKSVEGMASVNLQFLDVSQNQLADLDLPIQDGLEFADLSYNNLTNVLDVRNTDLGRLTNLSHLDLSNNSLTAIGSIQSIAQNSASNPDGNLTTLDLSCNPTFDCSNLGVDGTYAAMQSSQCADFNTDSNTWIVQPHPSCPP